MVSHELRDLYRIRIELSQLTEEELGADRIDQLRSLPIDLSLKELTDQNELVAQLVKSWEKKVRSCPILYY